MADLTDAEWKAWKRGDECTCVLLPSAADPACPRHGEPKSYEQLRREHNRLHAILWRIVDARWTVVTQPNGVTDRLLLNVDPALWREAADAIGYDEMGG